MPALDPDHVDVVARQFHNVDCLVSTLPYPTTSKAHRKRHEKQAAAFLSGLHDWGFVLTSKEH